LKLKTLTRINREKSSRKGAKAQRFFINIFHRRLPDTQI